MTTEHPVSINIVSNDNCPACDKLQEIVGDLLNGTEFLQQNVTEVQVIDPTEDQNEFPVMQIVDAELGSDTKGQILYECVGCYSRATVLWKLISRITRRV